MSTIYDDAVFGDRRYRVNGDGSVEESRDGSEWAPAHDDTKPTACFCKFGIVATDERFRGGNTDMSRGANWAKLYTCRTCRGLNGPIPSRAG